MIAGVQGLVAFVEVDGTLRVAETAPGSDGYLQQLLAGQTYDEVRAQFLAATGTPTDVPG